MGFVSRLFILVTKKLKATVHYGENRYLNQTKVKYIEFSQMLKICL